MPGWDETDSQWRYRIKDPNDFDGDTFRTKKITDGVSMIIGKLKGESTMTGQSWRFEKEKFPGLDDAKTWHEEHKDEGKSAEDDMIVSFGQGLKTFDKRGRFREVGAIGIEFTDETRKDFDGEFFTPNTYYGTRKGDGAYCLFHHGIPVHKSLTALSRKLFQPVKLHEDDAGLFYSTVLDMADEYDNIVYDLCRQEKLRWSSGALPPAVQKKADTGEIESWPVIELSFTPTPANPDLPRIMDTKTLKGIVLSDIMGGDKDRETDQLDRDSERTHKSGLITIVKPQRRERIWISS